MEFWSGHDLNNDGSPDLFIHHKHNDPNGFLGVFLLCFMGVFVTSFLLFASFDDEEGTHLIGIGIFSILGSAGIAALIGSKVCLGAPFSGLVPLGAILGFLIIGPIGIQLARQSTTKATVAKQQASEAQQKAELQREWAQIRAKRAAAAAVEAVMVEAQTQRFEAFKSSASMEGWTFDYARSSSSGDGIISYETRACIPRADGDAVVSIVFEPAKGSGFASLHFFEDESKHRSVPVRSFSLEPNGMWNAHAHPWETVYIPSKTIHQPDPEVAGMLACRLIYSFTEAVKNLPTRVAVEN